MTKPNRVHFEGGQNWKRKPTNWAQDAEVILRKRRDKVKAELAQLNARKDRST